MKKILVLLGLFILTATLKTVSAETFPDFLPGGKNYLDTENFEVSGSSIISVDQIKIKSNQSYTLSLPDDTVLGDNIYIMVEGVESYIDEYAPQSSCMEVGSQIICTFTTSPTEEYIDIHVSSQMMDLFFEYYQLDGIMLEEGLVASTYEPYIAPYIDSVSPEFQGTGAYIKSYQSNETIVDIISQHIIVYDEIDGDLSDQIVIEEDSYSGNEYTVGDYLVELSVSDNAGNIATFDLYIFVKDEVVPIITSDDVIYLDVESGWALNDILTTFVSYSDEYDPNPTLTVTVDEYTGNENILGTYIVSLELEDSSSNITTKNISFVVEDVTSPTLNSTSIFDVDVSSPIYISEIIAQLEVSDNYDSTVDITIVNDGYSGSESVIGTYFVDIELVDDSMNITPILITIEVSDNNKPTIKGPSEISISYTEEMLLSTLKEMFLVIDNYDTMTHEDLIVVLNEYSGNTSNPGTYSIEFEVSDSTGNTTNHTVMLTVIDDVSPIIYIDSYIVVVDIGSTFEENDMLKLLRMSELITTNQYEIVTLQDEYSGNEDVVGDYIYKVKLTDTNGEELIKEFTIQVVDDETESSYVQPIVYTSIAVSIVIGAFIYRKIK